METPGATRKVSLRCDCFLFKKNKTEQGNQEAFFIIIIIIFIIIIIIIIIIINNWNLSNIDVQG